MNKQRIDAFLDATGLTVPPGGKKQGYLRLGSEPGDYDVPLAVVRGREPGPITVVIGGIHGGEHNSIEAPRRIAQDLAPKDVRGLVAVVPLANRSAFHARSHNGSPPDGQNLAGIFPGSANGKVLERVAHMLTTRLILHADTVLELHGADALEVIIPHVYVPEQPTKKAQTRPWTEWDLADVFSIDIVAPTPHRDPGSPVNVAAAAGIPAILAEAGSGDLSEEAIGILYRGIVNVMRRVGNLEGLPLIDRPKRTRVRYVRVSSPMSGFFYPGVAVGQFVESGQPIGEVTDYFGDERITVTAPEAGKIGFIKKTMATNKGNGLFSIAVEL
jgi:predicted deacylase